MLHINHLEHLFLGNEILVNVLKNEDFAFFMLLLQ
jgi:hypothetical protein